MLLLLALESLSELSSEGGWREIERLLRQRGVLAGLWLNKAASVMGVS